MYMYVHVAVVCAYSFLALSHCYSSCSYALAHIALYSSCLSLGILSLSLDMHCSVTLLESSKRYSRWAKYCHNPWTKHFWANPQISIQENMVLFLNKPWYLLLKSTRRANYSSDFHTDRQTHTHEQTTISSRCTCAHRGLIQLNNTVLCNKNYSVLYWKVATVNAHK